jgi:hypothetical protein
MFEKKFDFFHLYIFLNFKSLKPWIRIGFQSKMLDQGPKHVFNYHTAITIILSVTPLHLIHPKLENCVCTINESTNLNR